MYGMTDWVRNALPLTVARIVLEAGSMTPADLLESKATTFGLWMEAYPQIQCWYMLRAFCYHR